MRIYEIILSDGTNKIIEANYITVQEGTGVTIFWFEEYNDIHTIIAVAPPTAFITQLNDEL